MIEYVHRGDMMKTIIFDFDGTLTKKSNEIWRNIWIKLDALDIDEMLYNKFSNNESTYTEWCNEIEKEFIKRNLNSSTLDELISKIEMMDNLSSTLSTLKSKGYDLRILSGGIDYVIKTLLKDNVKYFSDIKSTIFKFDDNGYLTKIIDTDSDEGGKARYILNYMKETNTDPKDVIFIGNGHNDRYVSSTGCSTICINPNGTNHLDEDIWHNYIESSQDLNDILDVIDKIHSKRVMVLASSNTHKIKEFKEMFENEEVLSLKDINFNEEIEETGTTFFENALIKAKTIHNFLKDKNIEASIIADDSGLCVDELNGLPGVYSARYAGSHGNNKANRKKLLNELKDKKNRSAHFTCCLVEYFPSGDYIHVEGHTHGSILNEEKGDTSFGYDCLFYSNDLNKSFGEASEEEKNSVSHRGRAITKLKEEEIKYYEGK